MNEKLKRCDRSLIWKCKIIQSYTRTCFLSCSSAFAKFAKTHFSDVMPVQSHVYVLASIRHFYSGNHESWNNITNLEAICKWLSLPLLNLTYQKVLQFRKKFAYVLHQRSPRKRTQIDTILPILLFFVTCESDWSDRCEYNVNTLPCDLLWECSTPLNFFYLFQLFCELINSNM